MFGTPTHNKTPYCRKPSIKIRIVTLPLFYVCYILVCIAENHLLK